MNNLPVFRASYSILNSWSMGYAQDAIDMYFKLPRATNQYMEDGKKFHESWQKYIEANKELHPQLWSSVKKLTAPHCELKLTMPISDTIEFVGVVDCLDAPTIYEFKTGTRSADDYARSHQSPLYALLCHHHGYSVDKAFYLHFNQYLRETDSALVWLTDGLVNQAKDWLVETAESMRNYLIANNYYEKYPVPVNDVVV